MAKMRKRKIIMAILFVSFLSICGLSEGFFCYPETMKIRKVDQGMFILAQQDMLILDQVEADRESKDAESKGKQDSKDKDVIDKIKDKIKDYKDEGPKTPPSVWGVRG